LQLELLGLQNNWLKVEGVSLSPTKRLGIKTLKIFEFILALASTGATPGMARAFIPNCPGG